LISREGSGELGRYKYAKINSKDFVRCVPAVVRGGCTAMAVIVGMKVRRRLSKRRSSVTFVPRAV
jgi:hypothetical protein